MNSSPQRSAFDREFDFTDDDFIFVSDLVKQRSGIVLGDNKHNMVYGRLSRRLRVLGLTSFKDYCNLITSPRGDDELMAFINAMTTNLTKFFRENHHFEHLAKVVIPAKLERARRTGDRRFRIWSAGSSSGEEPYTIAMVLRENIPDIAAWDCRILASDIDTNMLQHSREGIYTKERIDNIPLGLRDRYVKPVPGNSGHGKMADELRAMIAFKPLNLHDRWPMKGPFDLIFCRNVVIYFDKPTQKVLFERMEQVLADDGFLYVGHSENLMHTTKKFKLIGQSIYTKAGRP